MNYNELNKILNEINKWYSRRTKVLSIKTRPFNTFEVFTNIINKILNNNGKLKSVNNPLRFKTNCHFIKNLWYIK